MSVDDDVVPQFDWLALDDDEAVLWADTPHQYSLLPAFVVGVPLLVVLVGAAVIASAYLSHTNTNYVVTTAALYKKTGVLSRNVQRIEFDKVQDTSYRQSFFGAQFGYGTVDVSTAGGGGVELSFGNVADPQRLQTLINERSRERDGRRGEADDTATVLDDILTELRAIRVAVSGEGAAPLDDVPDPDAESGPDDGGTEEADVGASADDATAGADATGEPSTTEGSPAPADGSDESTPADGSDGPAADR